MVIRKIFVLSEKKLYRSGAELAIFWKEMAARHLGKMTEFFLWIGIYDGARRLVPENRHAGCHPHPEGMKINN